jgi:hypothetical protein
VLLNQESRLWELWGARCKRFVIGRCEIFVLVNGVDVCLEQAKAGFAWHYRKYEHEQSPEDRKLYADDEALDLPRSSIKTSCSQQTGATLSFQG